MPMHTTAHVTDELRYVLRLFIVSTCFIFIAWIAKFHFVYGGDHLFRAGTIGVLISLTAQIFVLVRNARPYSSGLRQFYIFNSVCLFIAYLGMMLKVSHVFSSQFEKDLILDFIGIPALVSSTIYTFIIIDKLMDASRTSAILYFRHILMPWILFLLSFLFYGMYSVILARSS